MLTNMNGLDAPEIWGGVECTVARIGERYVDQSALSGHLQRPDDVARFREIGIRKLRFPILWETVAPGRLQEADFSNIEPNLHRARQAGMEIIAGLLHHGSGPRHTSLIDPAFPEKFAEYAKLVASRYPWIDAYTPVNEPLTTARFSGLYGIWYPHAKDAASFVRCLLNECKATVLAMRAIRQHSPGAKLVQTDDLGRVFSDNTLAYQARFENERRWLAWDLLCGRVNHFHFLYPYLRKNGAGIDELDWFTQNPCPPDVIGINHYLSSNRYLDSDLSRYPEGPHGGNERHRYADVLAARVLPDSAASPQDLLMEAWERYRIPIAITEVHNGCTREEQLRWLVYMWKGAMAARERGAAVIGFTPWSLLGAFDWDTLLTQPQMHYEPGVFDIRSPVPRPTALAQTIEQLSLGREELHPVLDSPGWWQREDKYHFGHEPVKQNLVAFRKRRPRPILITGATGTLGQAFARLCVVRGLPYRLLRRSEMDIAEPASVAAALERHQPWAVVNAAGYVRVDDAESDRERCWRENAIAPAVLAAECEKHGAALATFSSDLVFDGDKRAPYVESDAPSPLNQYGQSKAHAESQVIAACKRALVIRSSAFFGPWDSHNFVSIALEQLARGHEFSAIADAVVSPTYVPDLVHAALDLLIDGETGIWHLANQGEITWAELAKRAASLAGFNTELVREVTQQSLGLPATRPQYSALGSERGLLLPDLDNALLRYTTERKPQHMVEPAAEYQLAS